MTFNKYINPFTAAIEFTPRPDGYNLEGRLDGIPAGAFYADYILDLRTGLLINFFYSTIDLGGAYSTFATDWLLWAGSSSGTQGDFTRIEFPLGSDSGPILSADPFDTGGSGILYDIDLREVSYQPYSRFARGGSVSIRGCGVSLSPIFPGIMDTAGNFVRLNSREQNIVFTGGGYSRTAADFQAGLMILDGDMFFSDTDFCILPGTATRDNLEGVISHNALSAISFPGRIRIANDDNYVDPLATVKVTPPALAVGGYGIGAINNLNTHPFLVVPSGTMSFYPNMRYNGYHSGSGLYVFNRSLWIQDDEISFSSGLRLINPHTGTPCWFRFADQTNHIDGGGLNISWSRQTISPSITDDGSDYLKFAITNDTGISNDNKLAVFRYSQSTLDLISIDEYSQDWTVFGASTAPMGGVGSVSFDGSTYYMVGGSANVARNIYIYDSGFTLQDSKLYLGDGGGWIAHGVLTGGVFWQRLDQGTVRELIIDPDPGNDNVTDTGIDYEIDVTAPGWPGSGFELISRIGQMKVLSGEPHFNDGTWSLVETTGGVVYFVRLQISGTTLEPLEGFVVNGLSPASSAFKYTLYFVTGGYT
jgi:hypothetical protein